MLYTIYHKRHDVKLGFSRIFRGLTELHFLRITTEHGHHTSAKLDIAIAAVDFSALRAL